MIQGNIECKECDKMFENITDISFSKNIAPFSTDIETVIASAKQQHKDECEQLGDGSIGPFTRTVVMNLPIMAHTKEGKNIDMNCKIWSRTMQNLIGNDIIQNIRSAGSLDLLDIDFEFSLWSTEYSEYHFSDADFFKNLKQYIRAFIKQNPQIEKTIVDNYCDGVSATLWYMKSKEPIIDQREKTTRELFISLGMPRNFVLQKHNKVTPDSIVLSTYGSKWKEVLLPKQKKAFEKLLDIGHELRWFDAGNETKRYIEDMKKNNEDIQQIISSIKQGKQEIWLDSKNFYLDNGDNLYDDIIEKSTYNEYYKAELDLIQENKKKIAPYLRYKYIGLWCGNGKKDYSMISENIDIDSTTINPTIWEKISKVILLDSSLRSLSKAEKLMSKNRAPRWVWFWWTTVMFSQERIDTLLETNEMKTLTSVTHNPKESLFNMPDIRESSNMFAIFGGTFWNFETYKPTFLKQMDELMNHGDILCISLFNPPKTGEEKKKIIRMYDTPEIYAFMKNFFIKLGIPEGNIYISVWYDEEKDAIEIDARVDWKDNNPIKIQYSGESVIVPDGTKFHCLTSKRMDEKTLQTCIDQSHTPLKIVDRITTSGNPFSLYMISK